MNIKNKFKIFVSIFAVSNLFLVSNTFAFGYPRDNFQRMLEFVHQRDEIRNLRQEPYRRPFNLSEERGIFQLEKDFYGDPNYSGYEDFDPARYKQRRSPGRTHNKQRSTNYESSYDSNWASYWPY